MKLLRPFATSSPLGGTKPVTVAADGSGNAVLTISSINNGTGTSYVNGSVFQI